MGFNGNVGLILFTTCFLLLQCSSTPQKAVSLTPTKTQVTYPYFGLPFSPVMYRALCAFEKIQNPKSLCPGGAEVENGCGQLCGALNLRNKVCTQVKPELNNPQDRYYDVCGCSNVTTNVRRALDKWFWVTGDVLSENSRNLKKNQKCANGFSVFYTVRRN